MAKLANRYPTARRPLGPTATTTPRVTHEGGSGWAKDVKTELFTLAVTNLVGENTFYETGAARDDRFVRLIRQAALTDATWTAGLIGWLRSDANMRTASIIAAVEYAATGVVNGRQVLDSALQRADEPGEALAYVMGVYGRKIPGRIKRGIADAARRLYSEKSSVKWDSAGSSMRMGDVIELCHPKPRDARQSALFRYLVDKRHNRADPRIEGLEQIAEYQAWLKNPSIDRLPAVATWENASAHAKTGAAFWEAAIPKMGYMAMLRNLRNFEEAGISFEAQQKVIAKLTDPGEVAASRQFPYRFWSAWRHSGTMTYGGALERAFDLSLANLPRFTGRTLVLVDTSSSMNNKLSAKSEMTRVEAAAVFGSAVAKASEDCTIVMYASDAAVVDRKFSALRTAEKIIGAVGLVGHGTNTWPAFEHAWQAEGPYDRALIFTDGQDHPSRHGATLAEVKAPVFVWDLAGYKAANIEPGSNRYLLGGLSDQSFKLVSILERGVDAGWPWENQ